ncbi:peptidoglycan DD-metalloendopeptidase family protein [Mumia zhuanghuii]|uniref:M23 family metallopeptidase n=1 Tax=Mumia zhuanghuii TaxID=2585211 RepID=A0A5C4M4M7_9ACTN|nr:peptidoglycan DD-metalloendopeptidase family protein [Mumia zhuanghuii]TNC26219.1 M23 family metallopeptidase [Mumia zhuanghuii]
MSFRCWWPRGVLVRAAVALAVATLLPGGLVVTAAAAGPTGPDLRWSWPLDPRPEVVTAYDAPPGPYAAGHRGVDLAGRAGSPVRAVDDGVVAFAGTVAGVAVVSVDHQGERSTYQPVAATVRTGDPVQRGDVLGSLLIAGGHCFPAVCLHLGRRHGESYADPEDLLGSGSKIRLVPPSGPPPVPPPVDDAPLAGSWTPPVDAPVSSPYGMRVHPITGELKLHDGTDFAAACGTPVRAVADGRVVAVTYDPAYGQRVVMDHGGGVETSYNHLARASVRSGAAVRAGAVVGAVGSTGMSTGCHLHFMVRADGAPVDPVRFLA